MNKNEINDNDFHFDDIDEFCDSELHTLLSKNSNQKVEILEFDTIEIIENSFSNDKNIEILEDFNFDEKENIEILEDFNFDEKENIEILEDFSFDEKENIEVLDIYIDLDDNNIEILDIKDDKLVVNEKIDIIDNVLEEKKDNNLIVKNNYKKSKIKKIVLIILLIIMILCLIFIVYKIINWNLDNNSIKKQITNIKDKVVIEEVENNENTVIIEVPSEPAIDNGTDDAYVSKEPVIDKSSDYWKFIDTPLINVDFTELINLNSDTVGWLQVSGTNINYPVVQTNNNDFYLNHSFDKKYNDAGWIFADYRNNLIDDKNLIIYGHSRLNTTMFGTLKNVVKSNWYTNSDNHVIKLSTPNINTSWQVFSTYIIDEEEYYIQTNFNNENDYLDFLNTLKSRSVYNYKATVNEKDRILTLSTCYINNQRVVLHAKLIKYENR